MEVDMEDAEIGNFKILVVDDNKNNIQIIGSILKEAGYVVGYAFNGEKA